MITANPSTKKAHLPTGHGGMNLPALKLSCPPARTNLEKSRELEIKQEMRLQRKKNLVVVYFSCCAEPLRSPQTQVIVTPPHPASPPSAPLPRLRTVPRRGPPSSGHRRGPEPIGHLSKEVSGRVEGSSLGPGMGRQLSRRRSGQQAG